MTERRVVLPDGTVLRARSSGAGPVVLLLHGGPGMWDYLGPLADLIAGRRTVVRLDQRGCGLSTGGDGPFTLEQAVDDVDRVRAAFGVRQCAVIGHSWGAELAVRYAAAFRQHVTAVGYVGGVGAGDGFWGAYDAERDRRLGGDRRRWEQLAARDRTPEEEREWCLLQWRPDFSPTGDPVRGAEALWASRPAGAAINLRANRELWADRARLDLLDVAREVQVPVTMVLGADDPRPWQATDTLVAALPDVHRVVVPDAGHAPWVERPGEVRDVLLALPAG